MDVTNIHFIIIAYNKGKKSFVTYLLLIFTIFSTSRLRGSRTLNPTGFSLFFRFEQVLNIGILKLRVGIDISGYFRTIKKVLVKLEESCLNV